MKKHAKPLVSILFPVLGAHICAVKFQYPDLIWKESCGITAVSTSWKRRFYGVKAPSSATKNSVYNRSKWRFEIISVFRVTLDVEENTFGRPSQYLRSGAQISWGGRANPFFVFNYLQKADSSSFAKVVKSERKTK